VIRTSSEIVRKIKMRRAVAILLFACFVMTGVVQPPEPLAVRTSDPRFAAKWVEVTAPSIKPVLRERRTGFTNGLRHAGPYEIAYCLVDENNKLTAPSPIHTIQAPGKDWDVVVRTPGLDRWSRAVGTLFLFRSPGKPWLPLGAQINGSVPQNVVYPYLPICGWQRHALRGNLLHQAADWPAFDDPFWRKGSTLPAPTQPPEARVFHCPNIDLEFAYAWRCNNGETKLSDIISVKKKDGAAGLQSGFEVFRNCIPPQGALGMHVYLRRPGGEWHRQPRPDVGAIGRNPQSITTEEYLWPLDFNRFVVNQFLETGQAHKAGPALSWLSSLQVCMSEWHRDVIIDSDQEICCPVVSEYEGPSYVRSPADRVHKFGRTIGTTNGSAWKLTATDRAPNGAAGFPSDWPMWVEMSQRTRLVGAQLSSKTAEAGISFCDHSGGGAFHFRMEGCTVGLARPGYNVAIRVLAESAAPDTHSASEPVFRDCHLHAYFPVVIEGNQSANWMFDTLTAVCGAESHETAIITVNNANAVKFQSRLTCDGGRAVFAVLSANTITIENWWLDQGFPAWFTLGSQAAPRIRLDGNKANQWKDWLHVVEAPNAGQGIAEFSIQNLDSQANGPVAATIFTPRYRGVRLRSAGDVGVLRELAVLSPSFAQWQATRYWRQWDKGVDPVVRDSTQQSYGFGRDTVQSAGWPK
jgi:hypothetical protein